MLFAGDLNVGVNKVIHSCTALVSLDLKGDIKESSL